MGLDTSHDCWHGSYGSFMRWRVALHGVITGDPATHQALLEAWRNDRYADQSVPINVLMNHSDCDGEIAANDCAPLADALEALLQKLDAEAAENAVLFIAGLRKAGAAGESVEFR